MEVASEMEDAERFDREFGGFGHDAAGSCKTASLGWTYRSCSDTRLYHIDEPGFRLSAGKARSERRRRLA